MNPLQRQFFLVSMVLLSACSTACITGGSRVASGSKKVGAAVCEKGRASFYSHHLNGCKTASGERYDARGLTAAHRRLPFGTKVRVKNLRNGQEVALRINDRGPYMKGRVIDVSEAAARKLGMMGSGVVPVEVIVMNDR
jgi:rare lipoprotein A